MKTKFKLILALVIVAASMFAMDLFIEGSILATLAVLPFIGRVNSKEDLDRLAKHYSNFEGKQYNFEGSQYTGSNDEFINFGGKNGRGNFLQQAIAPLIFIMSITNTGTATESVSLTPGLKSIELQTVTAATSVTASISGGALELESGTITSADFDAPTASIATGSEFSLTGEAETLDLSGTFVDVSTPSLTGGTVTGTVDASSIDITIDSATTTITEVYTTGLVRDGNFTGIEGSTLTGASLSSGTIEEFHRYLAFNPTALNSIKIKSNLYESQIDTQLTVRSKSPFRTLEDRIISFSAYQDQDTYNQDVATVPTVGVILGNQTELLLDILPKEGDTNHKVTVTFFCGASLNTSCALERKQDKAFDNFAKTNPEIMENKASKQIGQRNATYSKILNR